MKALLMAQIGDGELTPRQKSLLLKYINSLGYIDYVIITKVAEVPKTAEELYNKIKPVRAVITFDTSFNTLSMLYSLLTDYKAIDFYLAPKVRQVASLRLSSKAEAIKLCGEMKADRSEIKHINGYYEVKCYATLSLLVNPRPVIAYDKEITFE